MLNINEIYKKHKEKTSEYVFSKISNNLIAEEIVNDIFIKVFTHLNDYDNDKCKGNFESWLFEITNNTIIDYYRKKKLNYDEFIDNEYFDNSSSNFIKSLEFSEINEKIINEIKTLPKSMIKIAKLYFIHELSYDEISEALSIPLGTTKANIFRAKAELKAILKNKYKITNIVLKNA